jgi:ankyrin repeat protein
VNFQRPFAEMENQEARLEPGTTSTLLFNNLPPDAWYRWRLKSMRRTTAIPAILLALLGALVLAGADPLIGAAPAPRQRSPVTPPGSMAALDATIKRNCISCHNAERKTGGLVLEGLDLANVGANAAIWEKVATKLRTEEMPPPGLRRPDHATYIQVTGQLEDALDAAAAARPNPGRVAVHRLNRVEYAAAVRDLFGLDIDGKALLPADESDPEGFDNVASVLSMSPALLENYLSAARTISRLVVGDVTIVPGFETVKIPRLLVQDEQMSDDLPFGSRGGAVIPYYFPVDAEYVLKVLLRRQEYDYIVGMGEPHEIDFRIDGVRVQRLSIGGEAKGSDPNAFRTGYTALHAAILKSDLTLVQALLAHRADPNIRTTKGTPLRRETTDFNLPQTLVGLPPYLLAARFLEPEILRALATGGADVKATTSNGTTALMLAVGMGMGRNADRRGISTTNFGKPEPENRILETVRAALDVDPDATAANGAGDTALHAAAQNGFDTVIRYLVDHGAQVNAKNARGQTPLAVATQRGRGGRGAGRGVAAAGADQTGDESRVAAAPASMTIALLRKLGATE